MKGHVPLLLMSTPTLMSYHKEKLFNEKNRVSQKMKTLDFSSNVK